MVYQIFWLVIDVKNCIYNGGNYILVLYYIEWCTAGRILSPKLFSVHMDDISNTLICSGVGCYIDDLCANHVFCADDLCLMALCAIAV